MTAMKTAEAWARRMKKVTDRTRAKICLSILPPPPPPPPFTFPRLPLPLPPPSSSPPHPPAFPPSPRLSFPTSSSSNSVLFFLLALFALPHLRSSPSPLPTPPKLFTSRRGDGGEKPVVRFSNDASNERDYRTSHRFRSSIVRGDERERERNEDVSSMDEIKEEKKGKRNRGNN